MFTPHDANLALIMMIVAAICWGSWANTFKGVKNYRFELFYWDYAIGIFLVSLLFAFTMGSIDSGPTSFINNVKSADAGNIGWVLLAGVIFNLANLLLMAGIDLVGMATSFPVAIGIALVTGVMLSYVQEHRGNLNMLTAGILCAVAAVFHARSYAREHARALQRLRLSLHGRAAFLFPMEFLLHETSVGWRTRGFPRFLTRTPQRSCAGLAGRCCLGHRNGFRFGGRAIHRRFDFLRHRPIVADGCRAVGYFCLEGIRRSQQARQSVSHFNVHLLYPGDLASRPRKHRILLMSRSSRTR